MPPPKHKTNHYVLDPPAQRRKEHTWQAPGSLLRSIYQATQKAESWAAGEEASAELGCRRGACGRGGVRERNLQQVQAVVQVAAWTILYDRPRGVRGISNGQGCSVKFKASPCKRIATQSPGVLEEGHAISIRDSMSF